MSTTKKIFDSSGRVLEEKSYGLFGFKLERTRTFTYDDSGRVLLIQDIEKNGKISSAKYRYDPSGYKESVSTDVDGKVSRQFTVCDNQNEVILTVGELPGGHKYSSKVLLDKNGKKVKYHSTYSRETDIYLAFIREFENLHS